MDATIVLLPGDGIGPEVVGEVRRVIDWMGDARQAAFDITEDLVGGAAFYRKMGLERLLRDARAGEFHPLPRAKQEVFSGKIALGLPPV